MGCYYTPRATAAWPLPVRTVGLVTAARPPTVNMGFPLKGRYVRSQHTKSAPNGTTSALDNLSTQPIGGGSASSDCNISNSSLSGSTLGYLRAISRVVYPFPLILAPPVAVSMYATGSPGSLEGGVSAPRGVATFNDGTSDHSKCGCTCANCQWCQRSFVTCNRAI